jgi:hypothetical protein
VLQPHVSPLTARAPPALHTGFASTPGASTRMSTLPSRPASFEELLPPPHPSCATAESVASATINFRARTK